jgi:hypothetical protein
LRKEESRVAVSQHHDTLDAYRTALASEEPVWTLRALVAEELHRNDGDRKRVLEDLEQLRVVLEDEGRDDDDVLDVMSFVVGWTSPHLRL